MKKLIFPVLMLCLLFTACNSDKEYEVKVPDTEAYTTIAENTEEQIFTSDDGVVIIKPTPQESIIDDDASLGAIHSDTDKSLDNTRQAEKTFTTPEQVKSSFNGSLGHLSIDKIKLSMNVFETDNGMEDMKKGAAHFKDTSVWDGNIGLSAHNGGVKESASFGKLHTLKLF